MTRLAIICSHPIQYYAPVFKLLAQRGKLDIMVFYTGGRQLVNSFDKGFGKEVAWDIPLLEGYQYRFLENTATDPGTHHRNGIINPDATAEIEAFGPSAILVYGWAYQSHLHILRHFKGRVPVYFRGDSTLLDKKGGLKDFLRRMYLKWVYSHADVAFYTGTANRAYFKAAGLKDEQLVFAPHAIDNMRFAEAKQEDAEAIRSAFDIRPTDILVLFAGKFEPKKNPQLLVEVFSRLAKEHVHLLLAGNGILEERLKMLAAKSKAAKNIHFTRFKNQTEMPALYRSCDLFCLPSKGPGETWGLAVNEAMAAGKAVLVSDKAGCAQDLVSNGVNGYTFKSENSEDLYHKMAKITEDKAILGAFGHASQTMISSWSFIAQAGIIEQTINK